MPILALVAWLFLSTTKPSAVEIVTIAPVVYPTVALKAHIEGDLTLRVTVAPNGHVIRMNVSSGPVAFYQPAMESAKSSRYICHECTTSQSVDLTYSFHVSGECNQPPTYRDRDGIIRVSGSGPCVQPDHHEK